MNQTSPSHEEIERLAYQFWEDRGRPWATSDTDWFQAEQELSNGAADGLLSQVACDVGSALGHAVAFVAGLDPRKNERS